MPERLPINENIDDAWLAQCNQHMQASTSLGRPRAAEYYRPFSAVHCFPDCEGAERSGGPIEAGRLHWIHLPGLVDDIAVGVGNGARSLATQADLGKHAAGRPKASGKVSLKQYGLSQNGLSQSGYG